jgi:hypothetical protein
LAIVYHGLNRARAALCASAAGRLRVMLADLLPWVKSRRTFGRPIADRELVRRRLGRLAGLIVACDALVAWCANLLDRGFRAELECIVAKLFAADALREAAIELLMKTHGGRALLHGHLFGDTLYDYLAPSIYEGEGELLGLALFRALVKPPRPGAAGAPSGLSPLAPPGDLPAEWQPYAAEAAAVLGDSRHEVEALVRTTAQSSSEGQCQAAELSARLRQAVVVLCVCWFAARQPDESLRRAAALVCSDLLRGLAGRRPTAADFRAAADLGTAVLDGAFPPIASLGARAVLMPYRS